MVTALKIYSVKNFIRKNETGKLSNDLVRNMIREVSAVASLYPDHDILVDLRKTETPDDVSMADILKSAVELEKFENALRNRIATLIPNDKNWIAVSQKAQSAYQFKNIKLKFFTDFEEAINWFSDIMK